jgi:hypothetical protein
MSGGSLVGPHKSGLKVFAKSYGNRETATAKLRSRRYIKATAVSRRAPPSSDYHSSLATSRSKGDRGGLITDNLTISSGAKMNLWSQNNALSIPLFPAGNTCAK